MIRTKNKTPKQARRLAMAQLRLDNARWPKALVEVPKQEWPFDDDPNRVFVYRSRDYLVQGFTEDKRLLRASICRTMIDPQGHWQDRLSWEEIQDIKRQIGYGDWYAIEVYPRDRDLVNVANLRHIWILPEPLPIGWFKP